MDPSPASPLSASAASLPAPAGGARPVPAAVAPVPAQRHPLLTRGAVGCGVVALLVLLAQLGPTAFALGLLLAVVPVPVYVAMALWLDRFEPEPTRILGQTFLWGGTVAVLIALVFNGLAQIAAEQALGPERAAFLAAVVAAPVVEEVAKCMALLILFLELRDEFDGVVDGVVYAAMVGLGFAMVENIQYYGSAVLQGPATSMVTFFVRGFLSPFAHPLFTAMFGIGLGIMREGHRDNRRWPFAAAGLLGAVGLHAAWNLGASQDDWFFLFYFGLMVPTFFGVLLLMVWSLRREGRIVRQHLASLVRDGAITDEELDCLCTIRRRMLASLHAYRRGGVPHWRGRRELHRIASELAFHRWRVLRGHVQAPGEDEARERAYLARLMELFAHHR